MNSRIAPQAAPAKVSNSEIGELLAGGKSVPEIALITGLKERCIRKRIEVMKEHYDAYGHYTHLIVVMLQRGDLRLPQRSEYVAENVA